MNKFKQFLAIVEDTIREGLARKTILGMFIVSTASIVIAIFVFQASSTHLLVDAGTLPQKHGPHGNNANVQSLQLLGYTVLDVVWLSTSVTLLFVATFIGVFTTAGFITSMMEKGTIDLLLSKPVPRWMYIVGRYAGAVLIILVEVLYLVLGLWIVAGISLGSWSPTFLWSILLITLCFAGVFGLVTLIGIMTRSSWFAIILGLAVFVLASAIIPIAQFFDRLIEGETKGGVLSTIATILRYIVPHANEIGRTTTNMLTKQPVDYAPILIPIGIAIGYVGLSCWAFSKKEF